jgi:hypothetical protein
MTGRFLRNPGHHAPPRDWPDLLKGRAFCVVTTRISGHTITSARTPKRERISSDDLL